MREPLFCYLPIFSWPDGSAYKYYTLLKSNWGGVALKSELIRANPHDYVKDIQRLKPQLVFCHGDWTSYFRVPLRYKIPYIVFEHDVHSLRATLTNLQCKQERDMLENAAGVIFTSEDHREYCKNKYPKMTSNVGLVHLRPLKKDIAFYPLPKLKGKHLVYAGGIKACGTGNYGYRGYINILKDFQNAGWTIHIFANYTQQGVAKKSYAPQGFIIHSWTPYWKLTKQMSQFTAGLQTYNKENVPERSFAYTQKCRPNKTWDYLAAGIPTIGLNAGNCAKIYVDGGWGVTVPDTKKETLQNIELPEIDQKNRYDQVMENDIPVFERVINIALTGKAVKPKNKIIKKEKIEMDMKDWYIVKKTVFENGRLLYGRGRRITKSEAVRLGLVDKENDLKKKLEDRAEKREENKVSDGVVVRDKIKPIDPAELKVEEDKIIDDYLEKHPEKEVPKGRRGKSKHHK